MEALPIFDESILQAMGGMASPSLVGRMIDMYLETTESQIAKVDKAAQEDDWGVAAFAAHSLKSSSGNLGLPQLSETVAQIDESIRNGDLEKARLLASRVRTQWEDACAALRDYRARL